MLILYYTPTRETLAPHGTIAKCILDSITIYYIQVNCDDETPSWLPLQAFFEAINFAKIHDKSFMSSCLLIYRQLCDEQT